MKKIIIVLAVFIFSALSSFAQTTLLATLDHEGEITAFYGVDAIKLAHEAAVDGDLITLSGGVYNGATITKAITLRGTGVYANEDAMIYDSRISGDFYIKMANSENQLKIEGINFSNTIYIFNGLKNPFFNKCIFNNIRYSGTAWISNGTFINCYIKGNLNIGTSAAFINSYINQPNYGSFTDNRYEFVNCVVKSIYTNTQYSSFNNCILLTSGALNGTNVVYNCLAAGTGVSNIFDNIPGTGNAIEEDITSVFEEYNGSNYSDKITFKLTDYAAGHYICPDGTQVGMYGGPFPHDFGMAALKIVKCNVANKSTVDGKLSVDIEVQGVR